MEFIGQCAFLCDISTDSGYWATYRPIGTRGDGITTHLDIRESE